ncbi:MAG: hypothetical protein NT154_46935, partial [Verrucomicrobia bacterium]|nr:hypothetical protein [Verrucomicrobiota bacterium]
MKIPVVPAFLALLASSSTFSQQAPLSRPRVEVGGSPSNQQTASGTLLPKANPIKDFSDRLNAAIQTQNVAALQALYQTNGLSAQQLNDELSRWQPMLEGDAKSRVSIQNQFTVFRDFSRSNKMWKHLAERLTTHKTTHLVQLKTTAGTWMLPLIEVEGRLLIVPSDKSKDTGLRLEDVQPDGAGNESQPVPSNTNSTPGAAGSRR